MNKIILTCLSLLIADCIFSQTRRIVYLPERPDWHIQLEPDADAWFSAVAIVVIGGKGELIEGTSGNVLTPDEHVTETNRVVYSPQYFDAASSHLTLHWEGSSLPDTVYLDCYYPKRQFEPQPTILPAEESCSCPIPLYLNKSDWCSFSSGCAPVNTPSTTSVTHLIVHHSAGPNSSPSWPAVVNSIWNYHVNTNGWADIGYNWLIAPDGTLFQGRSNNVVGAHFCSQNGNTMGVCMLGTYTDTTITAAAFQTLVQLLAWKSCERNLEPDDVNFHQGTQLILPIISGHRDGCATECPGANFHSTFSQLRLSVAAFSDLCLPTGFSEQVSEKLLVRSVHGSLIIQIEDEQDLPSEVLVFDIFGRVLYSGKLETQTTQFPLGSNGLLGYRIISRNRIFSGILAGNFE